MIYHIVAGDEAAIPLQEAIAIQTEMDGVVVALADHLNCGPLYKEAGQSFSSMRNEWWNGLLQNEKNLSTLEDMEQVLDISNAMFKDETAEVWIWMAPSAKDVCMYHWLLFYFSKHMGRCKLVNIANLPFLNEEGKVFYPSKISEILPKELVKARRLARAITHGEVEIDGDEWQKLKEADSGLRTHEGGKKLASQSVDHYDEILISLATKQHQKATRIMQQAVLKQKVDVGEIFLAWRIKLLVETGQLQAKTNLERPYKDWDIKVYSKGDEAVDDTSNSLESVEIDEPKNQIT